MIGLKKLIGVAALAVSAVIWGSAAEATTLGFDLQSGIYNYSWTMDSDPTASTHFVIGSNTATTEFTGQSIGSSLALPVGELFFYSASIGGGLSFIEQASGLNIFDLLGDVIYSNGELAPHFSVGLFNAGAGTLTVTSVAATPIPAALPLFASALGGLGFFGWKRRKNAQAAV